VVNQFTVIEGQHNRRPDTVVFVNGLSLGVIELKNAADENADIWAAFNQLQTYKAQVPSLFHSNALLVISDGHEARLGTVTSDWERFMTWRTITGKELVLPGSLQLETMLKGVFDKARLLDLIRNFIVFEDDGEILRHAGGYSEWLERHRNLAVTDKPTEAKSAATRDDRDKPPPRKLSYKLQRELEALPAQIAALEARVTHLHAAVNDPALYQRASDEARNRLAELTDAEQQLETAFERWAELEQLALRVAAPEASADG